MCKDYVLSEYDKSNAGMDAMFEAWADFLDAQADLAAAQL
jgi:hypothetical protein